MNTPSTDNATLDLRIGGMTCASCSARVQRHLNKVDGVDASVNLATELAHVVYDPALIDPARLVAVVEKAGYQASLNSAATDESTEDDGAGVRLALAVALATPVVAMSMVPALQFAYWQWVALVLATPVVWWCGLGFHRRAWASFKLGEAGMDTLISIGSLAAWGYSVVAMLALGAGSAHEHMSMSLHDATMATGHAIYLEVASGVVTLILLGRWLEGRARRRAGDAVRALLTLQAANARVLRDGVEIDVPIDSVTVGDTIVVRAGETIPVDATVTEGRSSVDTSVVTGESVPRTAAVGDQLIGATTNLTGRLVATATRVGGDTMLAQIADRVRHAQAGKAQIQRLADRVSAVFVPVVILIAAGTLGYWLGAGATTGAAFATAVAVLIVACPCAMGLATPVALMVGTGRGAQLGILIGGAEVLESTRRIDTVVFDKTGTLTSGEMRLAHTIDTGSGDTARALQVAAAIEAGSNHPIARAICAAAAGSQVTAVDVTEHAGQGITAQIDGREHFVGSIEFARQRTGSNLDQFARHVADASQSGATVVATGTDSGVDALLVIADETRPASRSVVERLRAIKMRVVMLTGDRRATAWSIAGQVGINPTDVIAEVMPTGKADEVRSLQLAGAAVAMVGDGINDAPALAQADLGISMGSGSDIAIQASDITLIGSDIGKVADAVRLARRTLRTIQGNLFWAFAYNTLAIPLAASGHLNPLIAAAAMAFSSLFVVLNSLRLRTFTLTKGTP